VEKGNNIDSDSDYVAGEEEEISGSDNQSKSSGALEEEPETEAGFKEVTKLKRTTSNMVSSNTD
jgi:hypothetical protein